MKKHLFILSAILGAVLSGCSMQELEIIKEGNQEETPVIPEGYKVLTINASKDADTKTSYAGDVTFSWSVGDQISVLCNDGTDNFWVTFTATTQAASSSFTAIVADGVTTGPMDGTYKVAMFPASDNHVYEGPWSLKYNLPATRDYRAASGGHVSADIPMFAWGTDTDTYAFSNIAGAAKFTFTNVPASAVKFTFSTASVKLNGTYGLLYDSIDTDDSSNVKWNAANAGDDSEKTVTYYGDITDGRVSFYLPYATGGIWGYNTLTLEDAATGDILFYSNKVGTINITKNQVAVLPSLNLGFQSAWGIDWDGIASATNTNDSYPAIRKMKATADDDYLFLYLEVDPSVLTKDHTYDHYINLFVKDQNGTRNSYWGSSNMYSSVGSSAWAVENGNIAFKNWKSTYTSNLLMYPGTWYYEIRIERSIDSLLSATGTLEIGVTLDDTYYDGSYNVLNGYVPYGIIPSRDGDMYPVQMPATVNVSYTESDDEILNPERGMYTQQSVHFKDGNIPSASLWKNPESLVLLLFYFEDFINADLSNAVLDRIDDILANVRTAGKKAIVRCAYSNSHASDAHPWDAPAAQVLSHVEQLKPILAEYEDILYVFQAGFIGSWGEWYYTESGNGFEFTTNGTEVEGYENRAALVDALLDAVPASRQIALRTAFYKRYYLNPTSIGSWDPIESWDGTDANSRLAFHNDAFLVDSNDMGTFLSNTDRNMWNSQSAWLLMGGETGYPSGSPDPTYMGKEPALSTIAAHHISYLNNNDSNPIMAEWIANGWETDIRKALGYRLVLDNLMLGYANLDASTDVSYSINLSNTGSASVIYPRPFKLLLIHGGSPVELVSDLGEIRDVLPGSTHEFKGSFTLPQDIASGDKLAIWLPDSNDGLKNISSYSIRLANSDVTWENGYNVIYTF